MSANWEAYRQTMDGPSTLWSAAKANDVPELARLLEAGAPIDACDHRGYSPLMLATYSGNVEAFELLVARGADCNGRDTAGNTILMGAAFKGHVGIFRALLARGAELTATNDAGLDARGFATMFGRAEILAELTHAPRS